MSPKASATAPSASMTAPAPRWADSIRPSRRISTTMGLVMARLRQSGPRETDSGARRPGTRVPDCRLPTAYCYRVLPSILQDKEASHARSGCDDVWRDRRAGDGGARRGDRDHAALARERPVRVRRRPRAHRRSQRGRSSAPRRARRREAAPALARVPAQRRETGRILRALARSYAHSHGRKVGEIMTAQVITIAEDAELSEAVDLMLHRNIKRLPVLRDDAVVGVVSRSDLLKALITALPKAEAGHPDAEIRTAIRAELDKLGWAPRASVRVDVKDGAVTFEGAITDERLRSGLRVIAENTPGVTEVHDHMCWIEPNSGFYLPSEEEEQSAAKP